MPRPRDQASTCLSLARAYFQATMTGASSPVYFDATLTPNTALSPRAFLVVMGLVGLFSFVGGMMFLQLGAFPVIGWFGLDALAIWFAFRKNFQNLRQATHIAITAETICLSHSRPGSEPKTVSLPTSFTRLSLDFPDRRPSELKIAHGQQAYIIGRFLTPRERKSLHDALQDAIRRARAERFA
ncbi:MAG: hypothetical protein CME84_04125 [Henriciella sp.]|nr:hypothetical protein [Henriciella sp.]MBF33344.1 hypothetical protein [Hyphomonadaceae bacterium]PHR79045.1 MAG: hypothetical protein COA64_06895 [Henriciella sp.]